MEKGMANIYVWIFHTPKCPRVLSMLLPKEGFPPFEELSSAAVHAPFSSLTDCLSVALGLFCLVLMATRQATNTGVQTLLRDLDFIPLYMY